MDRRSSIATFYRDELVYEAQHGNDESRSPLKPRLLMEFIERQGLSDHFDCHGDFEPFGRESFAIAHERYLANLRILLGLLSEEIIAGRLHYVVFCHGADSHEDDELGFQLTTEEWLVCSEIFYGWVRSVELELGRPLPVALSLFGGYRSDDYDSVLSLHTADLVACLNTLCGQDLDYVPRVLPTGA